MLKNPFFIAGLLLIGNFLLNYLIHQTFEDHPFLSDIRTHIYHLYFVAVGLLIVIVYLATILIKSQKSQKKILTSRENKHRISQRGVY
ncbi:hypothetical protein HYU92_04350 [Candidatus Curtissbacteria bacterium]|nr:hypothetical protein [Candidatus Curtissbacteria bacterium]